LLGVDEKEKIMEVRINGEKRIFDMPLTVSGLLDSLGINPQSVVVERNLQIVARSKMDQEPIENGDTLEIIKLVSGG
jgi:thiamine biosynthesis protein ThiS